MSVITQKVTWKSLGHKIKFDGFLKIIISYIREPLVPGRVPRNLTKPSLGKANSLSIRKMLSLLGQDVDSLVCHMEKWAAAVRKQRIIKEETVGVRWKPFLQSNPFRPLSSSAEGAAASLRVGDVGSESVSNCIASEYQKHYPEVWFCSSKPATSPPIQRGGRSPCLFVLRQRCPWPHGGLPNDHRA